MSSPLRMRRRNWTSGFIRPSIIPEKIRPFSPHF
jgi:hypothetical protein